MMGLGSFSEEARGSALSVSLSLSLSLSVCLSVSPHWHTPRKDQCQHTARRWPPAGHGESPFLGGTAVRCGPPSLLGLQGREPCAPRGGGELSARRGVWKGLTKV